MRVVRDRIGFLALLAAAVFVAACGTKFDVKKYKGDNEQLYRISSREFARHNWDDAVQGFEKLTLDLPAHDTLLSRSYFYLAQAHEHKGEFLLAAQSYSRLAESFPDDTLADQSLYRAGQAYERMWRRPDLDAQYGEQALSSFQQLVTLYPGAKTAPAGQRQIDHLNEWFALKDYQTGRHYLRRGAYDSAIIYFKDVLKKYPTAATSRLASLRLVDAYRKIKYTDDANDVCAQLRTSYPQDREVQQRCGVGTVPSTPPRPPS
jgi:outer membrane protein assembly factor BamD